MLNNLLRETEITCKHYFWQFSLQNYPVYGNREKENKYSGLSLLILIHCNQEYKIHNTLMSEKICLKNKLKLSVNIIHSILTFVKLCFTDLVNSGVVLNGLA